jgi:hypothetical protein
MALNELRVFIAKSFSEPDKLKVAPIESLLESFSRLGVQCETGEAAEPESVSVKVRERIDRAQVFVGVVTRRHPITTTTGFAAARDVFLKRWSRWSAPPWVLQEVGYALKGEKTIILFIEHGVEFGGLQSDLEYIPYNFRNPAPALTTAAQMLNDAIAKNFGITVQVAVQQDQPSRNPEDASSGSDQASIEAPPPEESDPMRKHFFDLLDGFQDHDFLKAEQAFQGGLTVVRSSQEGSLSEEDWNLFYFSRLAQAGEKAGIEGLEARIREKPESARAHSALGTALKEYGSYDRATSEFLEASRLENPPDSFLFRLRAAECLLKGNEPQQARSTLDVFFREWPSLSADIRRAVLEQLFDVNRALGESVLAQAAAELALKENPANYELRFRLALEYGERGSNELNLFHNKLIVDHNDRHVAANHNLGVALSNCGLPISSISRYRRSLDLGETLSANNIARKYIESGFAPEAEQILTEAMKKERCDAAVPETLGHVHAQRTKEEQDEQEKLKFAEEQRRQRVRLAEGLLYQGVPPIDGTWETKAGPVPLTSGDGRVNGSAERALDGLTANLLKAFGTTSLPRKRTIAISGDMRGRVCAYKMKITEGYTDSPLYNETVNSSGFIVFDEDWARAEMLEVKGGRVVEAFEMKRIT